MSQLHFDVKKWKIGKTMSVYVHLCETVKYANTYTEMHLDDNVTVIVSIIYIIGNVDTALVSTKLINCYLISCHNN